jgi:hypothetical protein
MDFGNTSLLMSAGVPVMCMTCGVHFPGLSGFDAPGAMLQPLLAGA